MYLGRLDEAREAFDRVLEGNPDSVLALVNSGVIHKDKQQALKRYARCLELEPENPIHHFNLGQTYFSLREHAKAAHHYRECLRLEYDTPAKAWLKLGSSLFELGKEKGGLEAYARSEKLDKTLAALSRYRVKKLINEGKAQAALDVLREAVKAGMEPGPLYGTLGYALMQQNEDKLATELLRKAVTASPDDPAPWHNLGLVLRRLRNPRGSLSALVRSRKLDPHYADIHNEIGITFYDLGRWDDAIESYQRAIELKHKGYSARLNLGNAWARKGDYTKAIEAYRQGLRIKNAPELHHGIGLAFARLEKPLQALDAFNSALEADPRHVPTWFSKGVTLTNYGCYEAAIQAYRTCLRLNPGHGIAANNLAWALASIGRFAEGLEVIDEFELHGEPSWRMLINRGWILQMLGREAAALEACASAAALHENDGVVSALGWRHLARGNLDKAIELLGRAVDLAPSEDKKLERARDLRDARALQILHPVLADFTKQRRIPRNARESLLVARLCVMEGQLPQAVRFFSAAFKEDADLEDRWLLHAIRAAGRATGKARAGLSGNAAVKDLRMKALAWLRRALDHERRKLQAKEAKKRYEALQAVRLWKVHESLDHLRSPAEPPGAISTAEAQKWRALWKEIDAFEEECGSKASRPVPAVAR
jgi:tetratricopeptide (TPR) repeat protein